jgi:hypothetical protein
VGIRSNRNSRVNEAEGESKISVARSKGKGMTNMNSEIKMTRRMSHELDVT